MSKHIFESDIKFISEQDIKNGVEFNGSRQPKTKKFLNMRDIKLNEEEEEEERLSILETEFTK